MFDWRVRLCQTPSPIPGTKNGMLDVPLLFHEVEDPRRSNATRHDLQEMLLIALLSALSGGEGCVDMECFGRAKEGFLRLFLRLEHGIPSHDALTSLLDMVRAALQLE